MKSIQLFIRLSRPVYKLIAVLLYFLGIGISHYLNGQVDWQAFFLGLAWLVFVLLGFQYLNEYFDFGVTNDDPPWWQTPFSGSTGTIGVGKLSRQVALWAGLTCLTVAASLTVLLFRYQWLNLMATLILAVVLLGEMMFSLPPFRLISSGYGELITSIVRVGFIPAFAYALQGHELHRLLIMVAFPLVPLYLGMLMALELPTYASDTKFGMRSIITRMGWQRAMILHNILILGSFVLLGIGFIFGLPLKIGWPVFIDLPVGIFQIWMLNRIAEGAKPNWNLVVINALATFAFAAYLLTFAFWTH